ncbi:hypothetical protein L1049_017829 [Liquidambar formosana]|uniref:NAD(P)-binding domain-containing protein n=1 Tax=Liquidambar formosana TaxID=63359 RepID=A0AAP0NJR9_LIQFO
MASKLLFSPIPDFHLSSEKFPNPPQRIPLIAHPPLKSPPGYCFKSISNSRGGASIVHAVKEDLVTLLSGQLIVASLINRNIKSRLLLRDLEKGTNLFGKQDEDKLQVCEGDTRNPEALHSSIFEGITHVICCTGTTAFPSKRWEGDNTPERVDWEGVRNLVSALPSSVKRIVLVSSVGVTKCNELPWSIMNLFGVLKYKKMGEDFVRNSGIPFTIIRPGRLTDGPYTSYDLNTLLKATAGQRRAVLIGQGFVMCCQEINLLERLADLWIAEACIQALDIEFTEGQIYELNSVEGEGPGSDQQKWRELFKTAQAQ